MSSTIVNLGAAESEVDRLRAINAGLLAALRRCLDAGVGSDGRMPSASEQARAAIAKATGEQA